MRILWLLSLFCFSFNVWAHCPDESAILTDTLRLPIGKNGIIAVVKGTLSTEEDEDGFLVSNINVITSYGLAISPGNYLISEENLWGMDCVFYQERMRRPHEKESNDVVYFALSRFHGRTFVTPENESYGFFLVNKKVFYKNSSGVTQHIEQSLFERNLLTGIPKKYWRSGKL